MAIKVTFYNDVNIAKNPDFVNKAQSNDNVDFGAGGIYFTPEKQILEGASNNTTVPAHIVQKGYIYTLGSYVCSEKMKDSAELTASNINGTTNNVYKTNECYVVTDIVSDPYNKSITAYKQQLKLGPVLEGVENNLTRLNKLCTTSKSVTIGSHKLLLTISATGELSLSTGNIEEDSCTLTYSHNTTTNKEFASGDNFNLSSKNYVLSFKTICKVTSATIDNTNVKYSQDAGSNLKCIYGTDAMPANLVTVTIPATGWDLKTTNNSTSVNYKVTITTQDGEDNGTLYNGKTYEIKIKVSKIKSTLSLTGKTLTASTDSTTVPLASLFDTSGTHSDLGWVLSKVNTPANCGSSWNDLFISGNDTCKVGKSYEMPDASVTVTCNYYASVSNTYSIYYPADKTTSFTVNGGKQWTLKFDNDGTVTTKNAYYNNNFQWPSNPTKSGYSFEGWFVKNSSGYVGSKITSVKAGSTVANATWSNHTITLYAKWNQNAQYYWYVGTSNPSTMTSISPVVNDNTSIGWRLIGASVPTYTMATPLWDGQINEIVFADYDDVEAYIALPNNNIKVRDGFGNDVTSQLTSLGTKSIGGVNYYIFKNKLGENNCMQYSLNLLVY